MRTGLTRFRNPPRNAATASLSGYGVSLLLSLVAVIGIAAWLMLPEPSDAGDEDLSGAPSVVGLTAQNAATEVQPGKVVAGDTPSAALATGAAWSADEPMTVGVVLSPGIAAAEATAEMQPSEPGLEKSPRDGLRIVSQSWRRGGLGSKALVTFTLRNVNKFAVKDVEIACAFSRRNGSRLTERKRLIADTIATKSRKTYSRMLVGFVNVNANKAKCSVVTASRA